MAQPEPWSSLRLTKRIRVSLPKSRREPVYLSGPVVGPDGIFVGDEEGDNVKIDRSTLEVVWRARSRKFVPLVPLRNDHLLVGEIGDRVGLLDMGSKKLVWTRGTAHGGCALEDERVVVETNAGLETLNPDTGEVVRAWDLPGAPFDGSVRCGERLIWSSTKDDLLRCAETKTGMCRWERGLTQEIAERYGVRGKSSAMALVAGSVPDKAIVVYTDVPFAVSAADGLLLWHAPVPFGYHWPNVHRGRVYILSWGFVAIDEETGRVVYDRRHKELEGTTYTTAGAIHADKIAFPTWSGHLPIFDLRNGDLVQMIRYPHASLGYAVEADGRLLVPAGDGHLLVYEDEGEPLDLRATRKSSGRAMAKTKAPGRVKKARATSCGGASAKRR